MSQEAGPTFGPPGDVAGVPGPSQLRASRMFGRCFNMAQEERTKRRGLLETKREVLRAFRR